MRFERVSNFAFCILNTSVLIIAVSSRHISDSHSETGQDPSKSGKPGEYLWYMTSSDSRVVKSSVPKPAHAFEQSEDSGEVSTQDEYNISGDGEASGESSGATLENYAMSGSGSFPTSYMVDLNDGVQTGQEQETSNKHLREDNLDKEVEASTGQETNERENSGSGNYEGSSSDRMSERGTGSVRNEDKVKIVTPTVEKKANSGRRSSISRKRKATSREESKYDNLFKDFGTEGDLGPGLHDDDSEYLDDSLSEEEVKFLIPKEDDEDEGKSKSEISRPDKDREDVSVTFRDVLGDQSTKLRTKLKSQSASTKEILAKLDIDVFRGNQTQEHVKDHTGKHHLKKLDLHLNKTAKQSIGTQGEASRALSHHADSGIFNGSVSGVTLEAEKDKKHGSNHHHKGHHHKRHRKHHDYHRQHHARLHHHLAHKDNANVHLQQPDSSDQYSPQLQSPSVYYPYPNLYPSPQAQPTPYQSSSLTTSELVYHSLHDADRKGAVCLDGSVPGYYLKQGSGKGVNKWIIYLQGGAWCDSEKSCLSRSQTHLGSSLFFKPILNPGGLLSSSKEDNPKFYNWNVAFLPYCDGSSFSGNRSDPVQFQGSLLYFRGFRILDSTISALLSLTSLKDSRHVVFSGTSAGGLAVMLHADFVRSKLPKGVHFRALADSGFFLDTSSRKHKGERKFRKEMQNVFKLHDCTDGVPQKCVKKMPGKDLWKCIFPQYFLSFVKTKMFIVNPLYDSWQLQHIWEIDCASNPFSCTDKEVKQIKRFRKATLRAMRPVLKKSNFGLFADSCVDHGQVVYNNRWNSIAVRKTHTISSSFIEWLKNKKRHFIDDHNYPANPTCVSIGVDKRSDILTEGF